MAKKINRVGYNLYAKDVKKLPHDEIASILRAADELIMNIALCRNCIKACNFYAKKLCIIFLNLDPRHVESGFVSSDIRMS